MSRPAYATRPFRHENLESSPYLRAKQRGQGVARPVDGQDLGEMGELLGQGDQLFGRLAQRLHVPPDVRHGRYEGIDFAVIRGASTHQRSEEDAIPFDDEKSKGVCNHMINFGFAQGNARKTPLY